MVDAPDGGARANGEATSSHSSSGEEDTPPVVHCGIVNGGQRLPRRPLDEATRAGERWWPRQTTEDSARRLVAWTRYGGSVRALLVVSVGSVASVPLTVLLVFTFLLAAATTTAIVTSIVMSLAAAGRFMSVLFAFAAAMYIGAVSVAVLLFQQRPWQQSLPSRLPVVGSRSSGFFGFLLRNAWALLSSKRSVGTAS